MGYFGKHATYSDGYTIGHLISICVNYNRIMTVKDFYADVKTAEVIF